MLEQTAELVDAPGGGHVGATDDWLMKNATPDQFRA
jgi:hypothetical protein